MPLSYLIRRAFLDDLGIFGSISDTPSKPVKAGTGSESIILSVAMDDLPPELLSLIIDHCTPSCLKSLRLANRSYYEVVTPLIFEHFHLGILQESLDQFEAISKSRLAKYVKRCTVYLDRLPDWNRHLWEVAIWNRGESYWKACGDCAGPDPDRSFRPGWISDPDRHRMMYEYFSHKRLDNGFSEFNSMRL